MKEFIRNIIILTAFFLLLSCLYGEDLTVEKKVYKDFEFLTVSEKTVTITYEGGGAELEIKDLPGKWKQYLVDHKDELSVKPDLIKDIKEHVEVIRGTSYTESRHIVKFKEPEKPVNSQILWLRNELDDYEREMKRFKDKLKDTHNELKRWEIKDQIKDLEFCIAQVKKQIEILNK